MNLNVTVAEFKTLYPEFSEKAPVSAEVIDRNSRGRNPWGEDTFPEDLLRTVCYVHEMECRAASRGRGIYSSPEMREVQFRETRSTAEKEGITFTDERSPAYWQRVSKVMEQRQARLEARFAHCLS